MPGVVLWRRDPRPASHAARILPDGCMDLIWDGCRLFVAGPDTRARWHATDPDVGYVGLRFSRGIGPAFLGVPASEVRDRSLDLGTIWPSRQVRLLSDEVAASPEVGLEAFAERRAAVREPGARRSP